MNLNLVIDTSKFKPFEYYTAAVQTMKDYGATLQRYEDILNKIAEEKGEYVLPDSSQYKPVMDKYNQDYDTISSDFGKSTMNTQVLLDIKNIRKRYHSEISPIRKMVENYNKNIDKIAALGPDAIIGNKGLLTNVDAYYGGVNPVLDYRSGKDIRTTVAAEILGLDNALMSAPDLAGSVADLYFVLKLKGIDGQDALNTILNSHPELQNQEGTENVSALMLVLNNAYSSFAFKEGAPENDAVWKNVVSGAIMGMQAPKYSLQTDNSYLNDYLKAQKDYTEELTRYYRGTREAQEELTKLRTGYIAETDESGQAKRDSEGRIIYRLDPTEAAKRLKELNVSTNTSKDPTNPPAPPSGASRMSYRGESYCVKKGNNPSGSDWTWYYLNSLNLWEALPVDLHNLTGELYKEYQRITGNVPEVVSHKNVPKGRLEVDTKVGESGF